MLRTVALAALLSASSPALAQAPAQKLTPERVFADPSLTGPAARGVAFSPDGRLVTYLKPKDEDQQVLDLWAVEAAGGEPRRLVDSRALQPEDRTLSEAEKARRERARISNRGIVDYHWDDEGRRLLVPLDGDLYLAEAANGAVRRLTQTAGDEVDAKVSPKGRHVSFVRDQDLMVVDLATGGERAITTGGEGLVSYGVAEFIAQEEMGRFTGYWWSPDESRIAYTRVDESGVDIVPRTDIGPSGATVVEQRYPRAGRPNARVQLFVQAFAGGQPVEVDLGSDPDIYLARVDWAVDGRTLYVQRQSRDQKRLDLLAVDPSTGRGRVILTETAGTFINLNDDFRPLKDGTFLWSSERSGFRHLEHRAADGKLIRSLTKGAWPVWALTGVDESNGTVFFLASKDTPLERHLYAVNLRRPAEPRKLTSGQGWWSVDMAKGGRAFVGSYSDPATPPRTALYAADGRLVRWIEENRLDGKHPYAPYVSRHATPEFGTVRTDDGVELHYAVTRPRNFDPRKRYPAILQVYAGPTSQQVLRQWRPLTDQLLLEAGYVLLRVDNRGVENRGVAFQAPMHLKPGVFEIRDQLVGVRWLKSQPFIDPERVGVMGWSYGGYATLMLMTEPGAGFRAGAAGAPPTDWRLYDTHYTERYFGMPEANKADYDRGEVVARLPKLEGDLLLLHGMADDNVTFDNSTRVMAALQSQSRPFEVMLYPGERHGIRGQAKGLHLWRTYLDFFGRKLRPEPAP
jgi:dipeptidyl-peptidase-4